MGAFILLLQLFMAITSTGSAEIIAVSSILTYDIYYTYLNPELKERRERLRKIFENSLPQGEPKIEKYPMAKLQDLVDILISAGFFHKNLKPEEIVLLYAALNGATDNEDNIKVKDLYDCLNRAVSSDSTEALILLRMSKFFTGVFAIFMAFLAVLLQTLGLNLGWVYMAMGVIIGSAVGPASLAILMETANGTFIGLGAVGGLICGLLAWTLQAQVEFGEVNIDTLGKDMPFVAGNVAAILGGLVIAWAGSMAFPDKEFKWKDLNEKIPLVDDIEPPKDSEETDARMDRQVKIAYAASIVLTLILIILWPLPMHFGGGVFAKGGFTFWVAVEMLWALIAGITIITLPLYETVRDLMSAKKEVEETKMMKGLRNGCTLHFDIDANKAQAVML